MSRRSKKTSNTQRLTLGGVTGIVIVLIVLAAQAVGIDVLNVDEAEDDAPIVDDGQDDPQIIQEPSYAGEWYWIYFTEPNAPSSDTFSGSTLEQALVDQIDSTDQTLDVALYELNSRPVADALIRAHQEGVQVRVVVDGDHGLAIDTDPDDPTLEADEYLALELIDAGIPVKSDGTRNGFMHNKFFVFDGLYVWTGSTNITHNGIYVNNNNAILIRSSRLAENYTAEFEELFSENFGKTSSDWVPNPVVDVNGTMVETIFESEGDLGQRVYDLISDASSLKFLAFNFTSSFSVGDDGTPIIDVVVDRALAGDLQVQGVVEATGRRFSKPLFCNDSPNLNVRQDGNGAGFLHHKVMIIDESTVVLGSFNFSGSAATKNDENVLIIDNPDIARAYLDELDRRWAEAEEIPVDEVCP
jgi:phosphatidylserine/phosphatidylglycerophosphate/cardiolipin synthase-like enzyme